jgi:hypothetical protein
MISNDRNVNDHAFWDLYACCPSMELTSGMGADVCSAQCAVAEGQSWQELGECLSKRVDVVVCKPMAAEMGNGTSSSAASSGKTSGASLVSGTRTTAGASGSPTAQVSQATGAAGRNDVVNVGGSKMGVVVFGILALGSFAGMLL